jgi:hypothetical protein
MAQMELNQQWQQLQYQEHYQDIPKWAQTFHKILQLELINLSLELERVEVGLIHKWAAITFCNKLTPNKTLLDIQV